MRSGFLERVRGVYEVDGHGGRITAMEGMRGLAVLAVYATHYDSLFGGCFEHGSALSQLSRAVGLIGKSGVDLFFVISGYLIYRQLLTGSRTPANFWVRRVRRIYPVYLSVLLLSVVLQAAGAGGVNKLPHGPGGAAGYILENVALLPGILDIPPLLAVAWSLSYEMVFYTVMPVFTQAAGLRRRTGVQRTAMWIVLAAGYTACHFAAANVSVPWLRFRPAGHAQMLMFVTGILLVEFERSRWAGRIGRKAEYAAIALFTGGLAAYYVLHANAALIAEMRTDIWSIGALSCGFFGFTACSFGYDGVLRQFLSSTPLRWLGNMSYSFYLAHGLALHAVRSAVAAAVPDQAAGTPLGIAMVPVTLAAAWAASTALFWGVEKRFSLSRPAPPAVRFAQATNTI